VHFPEWGDHGINLKENRHFFKNSAIYKEGRLRRGPRPSKNGFTMTAAMVGTKSAGEKVKKWKQTRKLEKE